MRFILLKKRRLVPGSASPPPTLSSPTITADGLHLTATFSVSGMTPGSGSDSGGITLHVSGGTPNSMAWAISGTTLTLTLDEKVMTGADVTFDYVGPAPGFDSANFEDGDGNALQAFSGVAVTNDSTQTAGSTAPIFDPAKVSPASAVYDPAKPPA